MEILIIDSDRDLLRSLELLLEMRGCTVTTASSVAEALKAGCGDPNILLLSDDIRLEEAETSLALCAKSPLCTCRTALLTTDLDAVNVSLLKEFGIGRVFLKPLSIHELVEELEMGSE